MAGAERRERELKIELATREDHARFLAVLPPPSEVRRQENHYFDLPGGSLRESGVMLRLRIEDGEARLTVKEGARRDAAGIFDVGEREEPVDPHLAASIAAGRVGIATLEGPLLAALEARFGELRTLREWGSLENRRSVHHLSGGLVIEVDRARYPDGSVLHEIEVESDEPEAMRERLVEILGSAGVTWRPSTASKAERLARAIAKEE